MAVTLIFIMSFTSNSPDEANTFYNFAESVIWRRESVRTSILIYYHYSMFSKQMSIELRNPYTCRPAGAETRRGTSPLGIMMVG